MNSIVSFFTRRALNNRCRRRLKSAHDEKQIILTLRLGETQREILTKVWFLNLFGLGTERPMMNKTQVWKTSLIVSGVRKFFISKF